MADAHETNPQKLPVPFKKKSGNDDLGYHTKQWTSGTRGGATVALDFSWPTNPKQNQEERGSGEAEVEPQSK